MFSSLTFLNSSLYSNVFSTYPIFVKNAFLKMLAYRMRYVTGILTYLMFVSVNYFIWEAVFANSEPGMKIKGYTFKEMVTYISIAWISRSLYFSNIDEQIDELVKTGQISIFLIRPVNFHNIMIFQAIGESLFRLIFFTAPISIVIVSIFPVALPKSLLDGLMFLISSSLSFLVLAEMNFLIGLLSFHIKSIQGIVRAKYFLIQLLSGLLLPITFFPEVLEKIVNLLPFVTIAFLPLQCYLGKVPYTEFPALIFHQFFWVIFLYVLGRFFWKKAISHLTLQGG